MANDGERERDSGTGEVRRILGGGRRQIKAPRSEMRETRVRQQWLLLDWKGKEKVLEVRYDAINRHIGLSADDLDKFFSCHSIILSREGAIGFNWEHFKAIITPQEVLFNTGSVTPLVHEAQDWILQEFSSFDPNPNHEAINIFFPFQFRILDFCLKAVSSKLDDELDTIEHEAHSIMKQSIFKTCTFGFWDSIAEAMDEIKFQLGDLTAQVHKVRDELEQLKDDDKRKTKLCTNVRTAPDFGAGGPSHRERKPVDVGELETLLNTYSKQNIETLKKLSTVRRYVDKSESRIIHKHGQRNYIIAILTLGVVIGSFGFGLFSYFHSK
ncbi:hypothetical protein VNO80_08338 [Phaseolus coccineus]|uniref:Uncharacterized protein n=1 Tax=Phaseolus coccineus TaxID=3886 RepID=A0AAN9NKQ8_PHACN